jgi:hypothetical protein
VAARYPGTVAGAIPDDVLQDTIDWSKGNAGGVLTLRSAAMYVDRFIELNA